MPPARGCSKCRSSRVKCSGERPTCLRCTRLGLECVGYRGADALVIRNENANAERNSRRPRRSPAGATASTVTTTPTNRAALKSRYVAPQCRLEFDCLPWLRPTVLVALQPKALDLAVPRFLAHYVLSPKSHMGDDGYMADLPHFYAQSTDNSALRLAVDSCALASLAIATQSIEIRLDAQKSYGEALSALRRATADARLAPQDETLMALLVLDHYSLLGEDDGCFLGPHSQGIAPLLRLRGTQQLGSTTGWNLFRIAHRRMQVRKLFLKEEPLPESFDWISALDPSHIEAQVARNALHIMDTCSKTRRVLTDSTKEGSPDMHTDAVQREIAKLRAVEYATSLWAKTVPTYWRPRSLRPDEELPDRSSDGRDRDRLIYADFWVATTYNWHRMTQLFLHETQLECWRHLQHSNMASLLTTDETALKYSRDTATELIDGMLSSVPFLIGEVDAQGNEGARASVKEIGNFLAFVALKVVLASPLASIVQKEDANMAVLNSIQQWKHKIL